ncbi:hypothetical protein DSL72_005814 [Monilinia vaccinii-corymbosi]|uniref:Uncharacterized protein n=1 Tax=Monilinia vaccinii-corymbosi TaxID=61207 RepID=A0A8A3PGS4_9HELO|nr:hypothetical protein DSL72_005814 [Monilinia vaccinii-corymbosi]
MPSLRIQPRTCNSLPKKINHGSAARGLCTRRVLFARGHTGASLICGSKGPQRILAHSTSLCLPRAGRREYATATPADAIIEELTEQYGVARDEFEIASEETEKRSVYASDDRAAAVEELQKLKEMYSQAIEGEHGEEIQRRVGQRVRELEQGVAALEERAMEDH